MHMCCRMTKRIMFSLGLVVERITHLVVYGSAFHWSQQGRLEGTGLMIHFPPTQFAISFVLSLSLINFKQRLLCSETDCMQTKGRDNLPLQHYLA